MSKKGKKDLIKRLLSREVSVPSIDCKIRLSNMFTRDVSAAVILRRKDGTLMAVGYNG